MPNQPNLNKKEQEAYDLLIEKGQVQVEDLNELKKLGKKLENIFGKADEIYEQI